MYKNFKLNILSLILINASLTHCIVSSEAEVVQNLNCVPSLKNEIKVKIPIYSKPNKQSKVSGYLSPESKVRVYNYKTNNIFKLKKFIQVKTNNQEGWISTSCIIVGQDPENSVYKVGYKKDYKYFYNPNDKKHYPKGYKRSENKMKTKLSLSQLLKQ